MQRLWISRSHKIPKPDSMETTSPDSCRHSDDKKDFRGTTSTTWRWRCELCGYEEKGHKRPGITGLQAYMEQKQGLTFPDPRSSSATSVATGVPSVGGEEAQQVVSLLHHTMDIQRELDHL